MAAPRTRHDRRSDRDRPPVGGADNSPRFDRALARLDVGDELEIERTDRREIDSSERRPTAITRGILPRTAATGPGLPASVARGHAVRLRRSHLQLDPRPRRGRPCLARDRDRRDGARASAAADRLVHALAGRWHESRAIYVEDDGGVDTADETIDGLFLSMRACRLESRRAVFSRRCGHRPASGLRPRRPGR